MKFNRVTFAFIYRHPVINIPTTLDEYADLIKSKLQKAYEKDRHAYAAVFKRWDLVWVKNDVVQRGQCRKLTFNWNGPYVMEQKVNQVNYEIRPVKTKDKRLIIHLNRMKSHYGGVDSQDKALNGTDEATRQITHTRAKFLISRTEIKGMGKEKKKFSLMVFVSACISQATQNGLYTKPNNEQQSLASQERIQHAQIPTLLAQERTQLAQNLKNGHNWLKNGHKNQSFTSEGVIHKLQVRLNVDESERGFSNRLPEHASVHEGDPKRPTGMISAHQAPRNGQDIRTTRGVTDRGGSTLRRDRNSVKVINMFLNTNPYHNLPTTQLFSFFLMAIIAPNSHPLH
ncbi:hypothetical protein BpHYR1_041901 [Brachionus plicatilis]|uniref:Integrase p58-like C-terminal domain-containing protein n=1 Tax=Brachionus plicatilis TaxID=10195 RepID=A0A3M7S1P6_BRAPC|nr:hypothetical protein BpHYR1_041901 [Brachionus plicatilis]